MSLEANFVSPFGIRILGLSLVAMYTVGDVLQNEVNVSFCKGSRYTLVRSETVSLVTY